MKLVALEIPDYPALLPGWLEGHLVNTDLAALVAELEAVHGEPPDNLSLTDVLRDRRDAVLSRGLASLPAEGLKSLLRNPRLLLELQELILTEGGPCWLNGAAEAASKQDDLERVWNRLSDPLQQTSRAAVLPVAPPPRRVVPLARWIATFAAAAAIVLGVGVFLVERRRGGTRERPPSRPPAGAGAARAHWSTTCLRASTSIDLPMPPASGSRNGPTTRSPWPGGSASSARAVPCSSSRRTSRFRARTAPGWSRNAAPGPPSSMPTWQRSRPEPARRRYATMPTPRSTS